MSSVTPVNDDSAYIGFIEGEMKQLIFVMRLSCNKIIVACSTALGWGSFSEKNIEKRHLCRHEKNYYYFGKSSIPVMNLIVGSRYMIKL